MKIEFRLTVRDYQEAFKAHWKQQKKYYFYRVVVGLLLITSILTFLLGDLAGSIVYLLLAIIFIPVVNWINNVSLKAAWKNQTDTLKQPMTIEATADSLSIEGESFQSVLQWKLYNKFIETTNLFVIYEEKNLLRIIPKRAFANDEELSEFRKILQENINSNSS
ncbi:MAG: YcxB family protein [Cyanobacteria bacterium SBLK]|nr:YcxB family protein [Cyanobacteria bacterium SBLK]